MSLPGRYELPPGWATGTISDLIGLNGIFTDGDWVESKDQDPEGDVRLIQLADIGEGQFHDKSARFLTSAKARELRCSFLDLGDVLVARMPDPLGRACIFPGDERRSVTVVDVCIIRSGRPGVNHEWLMWFINSPHFRLAIGKLQSGSTRKRISRGNLAAIRIPVPPRAEQDHIVAALDEHFSRLDAAWKALERVRANLKRYRASVLKAACEGRLVPPEAELARREGRDYEPADVLLERILKERRARWETEELVKLSHQRKLSKDDRWKEKYAEPAVPATNGFPELPAGWAWASLDQLTVLGPQNGLYLPKALYGTGTPILRIDDFQPDSSRSSAELNRVNADEDVISRYMLELGDLVINRVNSVSHLGKCLVVKERNLPALFESNIMRLHLASSVNCDYIGLYLRSSAGRERLIAHAKWAVNQASINQQDVAQTVVPLPPADEQTRIVAEVERQLSVATALEQGTVESASRSVRLRESILKRAFEGRLVPQDPNDEPASVLLERIRAERAKESGAKRRRQRRLAQPSLPGL